MYRQLHTLSFCTKSNCLCAEKHNTGMLQHFVKVLRLVLNTTLSNVDAGETAPTPVTTVLSLQNLMEANKFLVLFNVIETFAMK